MPELSNLVSYDGRPALARLRRPQLRKLCRNHNIDYGDEATAGSDKLLKLLEAHGFDLNQPVGDFEWRQISGKDEHGNPHLEFYPVETPHESARLQAEGVQINYEKIIQQNAEQAEQQDQVIEDQAAMIKQLMARLSRLEENQIPLASLSPPQLKKIAKQRGLDISGLRTKQELLAALGEDDGQDAPEWSQ